VDAYSIDMKILCVLKESDEKDDLFTIETKLIEGGLSTDSIDLFEQVKGLINRGLVNQYWSGADDYEYGDFVYGLTTQGLSMAYLYMLKQG
jgi:hypothetical protein